MTVPVEAFSGWTILDQPVAPDGYTFESRAQRGPGIVGDLFGMNRYGTQASLVKNGRVVPINLPVIDCLLLAGIRDRLGDQSWPALTPTPAAARWTKSLRSRERTSCRPRRSQRRLATPAAVEPDNRARG